MNGEAYPTYLSIIKIDGNTGTWIFVFRAQDVALQLYTIDNTTPLLLMLGDKLYRPQ